ncbi:MAG: DUF3152 domain-containing protein, partial [Dactylosporangium sp.]|nr:DUF3152 domain-containing protein [Dactylosporangium sp.]NNJ60696.1 DUF3152 domain-containing protein [Dactylosporangium sp.]
VVFRWPGETSSPRAGGAGAAAPSDTDRPVAPPQPAVPAEVISPGPAAAAVPQTGAGTFTYGTTTGPVLGGAGTLRRFYIAVENGIDQDAEAFGMAVETILGDSRSWIAGQDVRFQRVPKSTSSQFAMVLATPTTSEKMCATAGLQTRKYTSCRLPNKVVINLARWLTATETYNASVEVYRAYAVNHEVGHELGHGHEACPGSGKPAPVMLQQTLGLRGCVANPWPYLDGTRYAGADIP